MGLRGPSPTPTATLNRRGSWRASTRKNEPKLECELPECPDWISDDARLVWDEVCYALKMMGIITRADINMIARYCDAFVRYHKAREFLAKYGDVQPIKDEKGNLKMFQQFPQVAIYHKMSLMLLRMEQEMGLTPASRSRVSAMEQKEVDPLAEFRDNN